MLVLFIFLFFKSCLSVGYHENVGIKTASYIRYMENTGRIIGGNKVPTIMAYPYQAGILALLTNGWTSVCGGSLVSNTRVLTAAHCWWDGNIQARSFTIVLGSLRIFSGGTRLNTSDVTMHPQWKGDILNDLAVVRIPWVQFNNNIQSIPLPSMLDVNNDFAGADATVSGFGKLSDSQNGFPQTTVLHSVNVKVLSNANCQKSFDFPLHGSHLCTDGSTRVGSCEGDSGGPLTAVVNYKKILIGVVSFGARERCEGRSPSVYTRVTAFLTWINAQL